MYSFPLSNSQQIKLLELNNVISSFFEKNTPFSLVRVGNMEGHFLQNIFNNQPTSEEFFSWLSLTSGVFPHNIEYLKEVWVPLNFNYIKNSDILGFVDVSGAIYNDTEFNLNFCKNKITFFGEAEILALDPGFLCNKNILEMPIFNPWTKYLQNKKVLILTSHEKSIKYQLSNMKNIWGSSYNDFNFDVAGIIRTPYHPEMDDRQYPGCSTWEKSLNYLQNEMDKYSYDIALTSGGAFAPGLADHAKNKGKIGITICGVLQLYFGILGSRWNGRHRLYVDWNKMFNNHWIEPISVDLPKNKNIFDRFEKAYW
jgi:hypothetical protein